MQGAIPMQGGYGQSSGGMGDLLTGMMIGGMMGGQRPPHGSDDSGWSSGPADSPSSEWGESSSGSGDWGDSGGGSGDSGGGDSGGDW